MVLAVRQGALPEIRRGLTSRTPVINYHDVIERRAAKSVWFDCTTKELEEQILWLKKRGAAFVSLDQLYSALVRGTPLPKNAVAITFADNYLGFYERGLPILRRHRVPVTMFVHTGYVGSRQGRPKMNWSQLRELSRGGLVTIASQTVSHPADLRTLASDRLQREMIDSKRVLERELGRRVTYVAYPNGKYDRRVAGAARAAGYAMGFTEVQQPAEKSPSIWMVNRYVHTKYRQAWADGGG
jgi:peptidoglycan/xylan/chitin deacetylase (PgdA/CDA1 family)